MKPMSPQPRTRTPEKAPVGSLDKLLNREVPRKMLPHVVYDENRPIDNVSSSGQKIYTLISNCNKLQIYGEPLDYQTHKKHKHATAIKVQLIGKEKIETGKLKQSYRMEFQDKNHEFLQLVSVEQQPDLCLVMCHPPMKMKTISSSVAWSPVYVLN